MAARPRTRALAKRAPRGQFGAACATSPRWVRGGTGVLIGGLLGGMIGGGISMIMVNSLEITSPIQSAIRLKSALLFPALGALAGGVGGLIIGAAKPECGT